MKALHISEVEDNIAWASEQLRAGNIPPEVAKTIGNLQGRQLSAYMVKLAYAKDKGERPLIEQLENKPVSNAAVTLAKAGANKRATANHRS